MGFGQSYWGGAEDILSENGSRDKGSVGGGGDERKIGQSRWFETCGMGSSLEAFGSCYPSMGEGGSHDEGDRRLAGGGCGGTDDGDAGKGWGGWGVKGGVYCHDEGGDGART